MNNPFLKSLTSNSRREKVEKIKKGNVISTIILARKSFDSSFKILRLEAIAPTIIKRPKIRS